MKRNAAAVAVIFFVISLGTMAAARGNPTVVLHLRAGILPNLPDLPVPANIPAGEPAVTLPVFPGATPLATKPQGPVGGVPMTPYLKVASVVYQVYAPASYIESWYETNLLAQGYQVVARSQSGGVVAKDTMAYGESFSDPARPGLTVEVDSWTAGQTTHLELWALDVEAPKRPPASFIRGPVTKVPVVAWPQGRMDEDSPPRQLEPVRAEITSPATVAALVYAYNSLPMSTLGVCYCPADFGQEADLTFQTAGGETQTATVDPSEEDVLADGRYRLADPEKLWQAVLAALNTVPVANFPRPPAILPELKDISGNWAAANIKKLVALGAITGYPDHTFRPNADITRAEFVTVLVKALDLTPKTVPAFADTESTWEQVYVSTAAAYGLVSGYDPITFGPNDPITREQMAAMIVGAAKPVPSAASGKISFSDASKIDSWALSDVATAVKDGLMDGYPDGSFKPQGYATRAEAVTVIARILKQ